MKIFTGLLLVLYIVGCKNPAHEPNPKALKLLLPKEEPGSDTIQGNDPSKRFTVILTDSNKIYYYSGKFSTNAVIGKTGFKEIRNIIKEKNKSVGPGFVVLIKGDVKSTYKNTVDMLDEMAINDIKRYALVDLTDEEAELLGLGNRMTGPGYEHAGAPNELFRFKMVTKEE
jgi:biopolymer transport protein ExbD